jgi:hypothetical protein
MEKQKPCKLYHGLSIDRFLDHWKARKIRGLSSSRIGVFNSQEKSHVSDEQNYYDKKGTWLADEINHIILLNYGNEKTGEGEVIADWSDIFQELGISGDGLIRQEEYKTRIIAELSGVPNPERLKEGCFLHDFFYKGDIPIEYILKVHIDQADDSRRLEDIQRLFIASVPESKIKVYNPFEEKTKSIGSVETIRVTP